MRHGWAESRFTNVLPKVDIHQRIKSLHDDMSTPWTFKRMQMENRQGLIAQTFSDVAKRAEMSDVTQIKMSEFLDDIATGRLKVYYRNPGAVRYRWGTKHPEAEGLDPSSPEFKKIRQGRTLANKVVVERSVTPTETPKQVRVGIGPKGVTISPFKPSRNDSGMPEFSRVVKTRT